MKLAPLLFFLTCVVCIPRDVYSQTTNDSVSVLKDLTLFDSPGKDWIIVADLVVTPVLSGNIKKTSGTGIIMVNSTKATSRLATAATFGDIELEFDFLLSKGARPAVMLQGRYRLNLSDSWGETTASFNSMGGIAKFNEQDSSGFSGTAPLINVAKAPGLWQHVRLRFRAPQFSGNIKTSNALLEEVYINDVMVQQNTSFQGPAAGLGSSIEQASGPIVFDNSDGILALRNVVARKIRPVADNRPSGRRMRVTNPITIIPEKSNYFLRGFLNFKNKKRTHVISVGSPGETNYSYDLKQGALLQVWGGPFLDVTEMWEQRGEPQLARPLGSVVTLSEAPALSVLPNVNSAWPDSVAFEDFKTDGYTLDKERNPAFEYETAGYHVWDKISMITDGRGLLRQLTVTNAPSNLYCRLAGASAITSLGKGWYLVGDKSYFIRVDESLKPFVRNSAGSVELLVAVVPSKQVSYSLIW